MATRHVASSFSLAPKKRGPKADVNVITRRAYLEADISADNVTPTSVWCRGCKRTIQLDKRRLYYPGNWDDHSDGCYPQKQFKIQFALHNQVQRRGGGHRLLMWQAINLATLMVAGPSTESYDRAQCPYPDRAMLPVESSTGECQFIGSDGGATREIQAHPSNFSAFDEYPRSVEEVAGPSKKNRKGKSRSSQ